MSVYVAFGLSGAGKSYFTKWAGKHFHLYVEDADHWLTDEMRQCIKAGTIFTPDMLDHYFKIVIANIKELKKSHENILISQALYLEKNRQQLLAALPDLQFILVSADNKIIDQRLIQRGNEVTLQYAKDNASYFEQPKHSHFRIENSLDNTDRNLAEQCEKQGIFKDIKHRSHLSRLFRKRVPHRTIINNLGGVKDVKNVVKG